MNEIMRQLCECLYDSTGVTMVRTTVIDIFSLVIVVLGVLKEKKGERRERLLNCFVISIVR